ncbi:hypothetical protein [Hoyosella altamirensis]|uniref:Uncharacterized protein n=1 Tax=Hoyosella altamirensis TaxID=616997 RepID=A0A839RTC7_9ACTN|nr:hypothetical protein [Hoyosella altamirensis]MBB3040125.1 hypothetical protein [Hoyosella altamirensis]
MVLPPIHFQPPLVNPARHTLYDLPGLHPAGEPSRHQGGVEIDPINCPGSTGTWPTDPCEVEPTGEKTGDRGDYTEFPPVTAWGADECGLESSEERALQNLRLREPQVVTQHFIDLLEDPEPGSETAATDLGAHLPATAIGLLEEALGWGWGGTGGVILAPRRLAALLAAEGLIMPGPSNTITTVLGTRVVFGPDTTGVVYATGPVHVWRDEVMTQQARALTGNRVLWIAERTIVVGHECTAVKATIA